MTDPEIDWDEGIGPDVPDEPVPEGLPPESGDEGERKDGE